MTPLSPTALEAAADQLRHVERAGSRLTPWTSLSASKKRLWCDKATAAITAFLAQMEKEGRVMVPKVASDKMVCAALDDFEKRAGRQRLTHIYAAMIAAAQNGGELCK